MIWNNKRVKFILAILIVIIARLAFSLVNDFWHPDEDVKQIYLIGLEFFTSGKYPFFGTDIPYTHGQIPGALQGLFVSALWFIVKIPEAPHIFSNIIISISLAFLAWYISKRIPNFNKVILYFWIFFSSWSLVYFTLIMNTAQMVPGAVLFWIGIFETYPKIKIGVINSKLAAYFIGFGMLWAFQMHASWVLTIPFTLFGVYSWIKMNNMKGITVHLGFFTLGLLTTGSLIIPTLVKFGLSNQKGIGLSQLIVLNLDHIGSFFTYLTKYLASSCFDTTRFWGATTTERLDFLKHYWLASPFSVYVTIFGAAQVMILIYNLFLRRKASIEWKQVRLLAVSGYGLMCLSSLISIASPSTQGTIILYPLVTIFAAYCFSELLHKQWVKRTTIAVFISAIIMFIGIGMNKYEKYSLYKNREAIEKALDKMDYRILGERRYRNEKVGD
ncbi:MAG: hypothetical protein NT007_10375 [Candidatus Kapabacteria bacterium]|nr:hypothetical protein [Candidatus Kapabacteria bacterium]